MDMFCNKCTLQFDKKYVFDLHLFLVHGGKMPEGEKALIGDFFPQPTPSQVSTEQSTQYIHTCPDISHHFFSFKVQSVLGFFDIDIQSKK